PSALHRACPIATLHSFPTRRSSDLEVCEVAEVTVTRVEPEMYVPPLPGAAVTRAQGAQRDSALYFDEMGSAKVPVGFARDGQPRSEEHTSELQSPDHLVCRLLLEKT